MPIDGAIGECFIWIPDDKLLEFDSVTMLVEPSTDFSGDRLTIVTTDNLVKIE